MVTLDERISEPGLRPVVPRCRVVATYPQGGTGIPTGAVPMVNNLFQGMPLDSVTGLYYERARWYSPSLGAWVSQDPAGYINGADTYQFVGDGPVGRVDAGGLFCWSCLWAVADYAQMGVDMVGAIATTTAALDTWASVPESGLAAPEDAMTAEAITAGALGFSMREYGDITRLITDAEACEKCNPCDKDDMESKIATAKDNFKRLSDLWGKVKNAAKAVGHLIEIP